MQQSMFELASRKIERLRGGGCPRVLDLFAGCGGMTLGFVTAGCVSVGGVELDADAAATFATNFHDGDPLHRDSRDITNSDPVALIRSFGHDEPETAVDLLIGGPPCPAFARVGRAKLREVHRHPEAHINDPRAQLYLPYLQYVQALCPIALVMENVPDFLNWNDHNLAEEVCEVLEGLGYHCKYTLLNAASYGIPQMRERFFLVAIHGALRAKFSFPHGICRVDFPSGYETSRGVALKHLKGIQRSGATHRRFVPPPIIEKNALRSVTAADALNDLPPITAHLEGTLKRGARRFDRAVTYRPDISPSAFASLMRDWPGFRADGRLWDHEIRSLSQRDLRLFKRLNPGDDYPKAHSLAIRLFERRLAAERRKGRRVTEGSQLWNALRKEYVPPYNPTKFPNKWRKMEADCPARTLLAHLGKDSYSHIHPDSNQARVISVREAARLQSFPDGFGFSCTMNPALRQIGNAVPPLLSWALAESVLESIGARTRGAPGWRDVMFGSAVSCSTRPDTPLMSAPESSASGHVSNIGVR